MKTKVSQKGSVSVWYDSAGCGQCYAVEDGCEFDDALMSKIGGMLGWLSGKKREEFKPDGKGRDWESYRLTATRVLVVKNGKSPASAYDEAMRAGRGTVRGGRMD